MLFRPDELNDICRTQELPDGDLNALRAIADWIETFIARPHKDLGRAGPVCPFVPAACKSRTLWLAPEHVVGRATLDILELVRGYQEWLLAAEPAEGEDAALKSLVVVFTDLPVERAKAFFDEVLQHLAVPSYLDHGLVMGGFHAGNDGGAVHNPDFHPFRSPAPFLLIRRAVVGDWKFFLGDPEQLDRWACRFGAAGALALAEEVRRLPWRTRRG
jgi:hypothetical protein